MTEDSPAGELTEFEELWRYEEERRERARRRNRVSWKITGLVLTAALAVLAYDSGHAVLDARHSGRPWLYPAAIAAGCALGALAALVTVVRTRRRGGRRGRHRARWVDPEADPLEGTRL